jgi:hypothetical protein
VTQALATKIDFTVGGHGGKSDMIRGIDASMDCTPFVSNLRALGVTFIVRYYTDLSATRSPSKALTPREAHDLCEAGFLLVVVWELLATPGYFSNLQGQVDGQYAYRYAKEMIRQPENSGIYFAVDFDATQNQFAQGIEPYFEGIAQGFSKASDGQPIFSVGVYGSGAVCAALKQAKLVRYTWLSQSGGWQGSQSYRDWDIKQGPLVSHPPFQFDENVAKEQFGAFRINSENKSELFTVNTSVDDLTIAPAVPAQNQISREKARRGK